MRKCDFQLWENNKEFMEAYSYRKSTFEKIYISYDSVDNFVNDLQKYKILKLENEKLGILKYLFEYPQYHIIFVYLLKIK